MGVAETAPARRAARDSPYVGLGFFTEESARWFFGRERERTRIIGNLRASRLTLLYAESGVGKSSLLRAGVASRLGELARSRAAGQGTPGYIPVVFATWGDEPNGQLIVEIERAIKPFVADQTSVKLSTADPLEHAIEAATAATDATLLVILDQFEDYFLYGSREGCAGNFADALSRCVGRSDLRANFLISLREDAYAALGDQFKGKIANVYRNYLHLERLDRTAARDAIERPIEVFNSLHEGSQPISIEPELVEAVLGQVRAGEVGHKHGGVGEVTSRDGAASRTEGFETPYLQLVMTRLWGRERDRGSDVLRLSTLTELGGAEEIVKRHLDDALSTLTAQERETAIDVFHYLVTPSGAKIAHTIKDLPEYSGHSIAEVNALIAKLERGDQRILREVAPPPGSTDGPRVEIFHDVLADAILDWRNRQIPARLEREKRLAEDRARRERRRSRISIALLALVVVVGVGAFLAWRSAVAERNTAESRQLAARGVESLGRDPELSALLALSALNKAKTSQAESALRMALPLLALRRTLVPRASVTGAAYSRDGRLIATAESDGVARVWDAQSHDQLVTLGHAGQALNGVAFSPDGRLLATAGEDGTARLWNVSSRTLVGMPIHEPGFRALLAVAFSPDGARLITASEDGSARIWDATRPGHAQVGVIEPASNQNAVNDAEFSPDGREIVIAGGDGAAQVWDLGAAGHGQRPRRGYTIAEPNREPLSSASFSPDGRFILTTSHSGSARIWDAVAAPQKPRPALVHEEFGAIDSAEFSPESKLVVTAGSRGARIFEAPSGKAIATLTAPGVVAFNAAVFAPGGSRVLTAGADGSARIWSTTARSTLGAARWAELGSPLEGSGTDSLGPEAFSSDGDLIAAAGRDGAVTVWQPANGRRVAVLAEPGHGAIQALAFEPKEPRVLITACADGSVALWDTSTGGGRLLAQDSPSPTAVAFAPPGDRVAVASGNTVVLYDIKEETELRRFEEPLRQQINEVAFNRQGSKLVTAGTAGGRVWNVSGGKPVGAIGAMPLESARFSPSGRSIVTAGEDGTSREWSAVDRKQSGEPMAEPGYAVVRDAEFSADGSRIVTASTDGVARIWDANTHRLLTTLAGHGGRVISASFSPTPGANLIATSSSDGTVNLWFALPREQQGPTLPMGSSFPNSVSFSKDGSQIVTAGSDGVARIWDPGSHRQLGSVVGPGAAGLRSAAFSADGKLIVTAGEDGSARIWAASRELAELPAGGSLPLNDATFSPRDRRLVVTAGVSGEAAIWSGVSKVASIDEPGQSPVTSASFSPDGGRILTTSVDGTARILTWSPGGSPNQLAVLSEPGRDNLNGGAFSADGELVVTASNDGTARVWSASTGTEEGVLSQPGGSAVRTAKFSSDGNEVLTSSVDGTARIWAWRSGRLLTEFTVGDGVLDASFAPNGEQVVTGSHAGAQVWSTELAAPLSTIEQIGKRRVTRGLTAAERVQFGVG
jgi:WD40 repeat protein